MGDDEAGAAGQDGRSASSTPDNEPGASHLQLPAFPFDEAGRERMRVRVDEERAKLKQRGDEINRRSGRNLGFAIGIGVVLGAVLLASLLLVKQLFIVFGAAMVALVVVELASAMRASGRDVPRVPSVAVAVLVPPIAYFFGPGWQWVAMLAGIAIVTGWRLAEASIATVRPSRAAVWGDFLAGAFIQLYVTFLGSFTVMLVAQPGGELWALGFILVVVANDTFAYIAGLNFGRHKLAPRISPGKTWEGFAGAMVASVVVASLVSVWLLEQPWWFGFVFGILLVFTATAGDLTESMIKRDLGIKDMSSWLPGHGGFFDRIDSILPSGAMAFALYFWTADLGTDLVLGAG